MAEPRRRHAGDEPYALDAAAHYRDRLAAAVDVVTVDASRAHGKQAPASSSTPTTPRKLSGAQLRLFFLLCVALYFATIVFASDIVAFAEWMSDDDPVAKWHHGRKEKEEAREHASLRGGREGEKTLEVDGEEEKGVVVESVESEEEKQREKVATEPRSEEPETGGEMLKEVVAPGEEGLGKEAGHEDESEGKRGDVEREERPEEHAVETVEERREEHAVETVEKAAEEEPVEDANEAEQGVEEDAPLDSAENMAAEEPEADGVKEEPLEAEGRVEEEDAPLDSAEGRDIAVETMEPTLMTDAPAEIPKVVEPATVEPTLLMDAPAEVPKLVEPIALEIHDEQTVGPAADDGAQDPEVVSR